MVGNSRFEPSSASSDSSFAGYSQRGNHSGPGLDRSGSFREGSDGRIFNSGKVSSRASGSSSGDTPLLLQYINLDLIPMGDQKVMRSGDLRRVLGASVGATSGDSIAAASHLKNSPPVEELKQYRAQVQDTCVKASGRSKIMDERLYKLRQYLESPTSKKQQRGELLTNERSGGSNLKIGNQIHRSSSDIVSHKMEDRPKNVILNKRVRTSMADTRIEGRGNGLPRQPLMMSKERDTNNADADVTEEKIRRLPAGGESWDKKMKRKRSVGTVSSRPIDGEGEPKRTAHHKPSSEPGLQSSDPQSFRSGAINGAGGVSKMDGPLSLSGSSVRATLKMEQDKSTFSRELPTGLNKERVFPKGSIKLSNREENHVVCSSPITKGKASRAPRSGATMATNSSNLTRVPGTLESWEAPQSMNKNPSIVGNNNRKRPMAAGSSSPPITQWGGQRPQKMSRTRRANVVSPVSNHDEMQTPSEGCSPDFGARLANSSLISKGSVGGTQNLKAKAETVSSPARFSESEESGAGETRLKEKGVGNGEIDEKTVQNAGNPAMFLKKNKLIVKEQIGDFRRQGRSGRGSSVSRASISPVREKMDNITTTKPLRNIRSGSEKNGSKSGRPLKKPSDRKGFSRLGHTVSGGSPDCTGESDDDREELLAAANLAYNSSVLACSSAFWKKVEVLFSSISSEGKSFVSQQLKLAEDMHENLSQTLNDGSNVQGNCMHEEISLSGTHSEERSRSTQYKGESKDLTGTIESSDQFKGSSLSGAADSGRKFQHVPLYQRVLSALIIEDNAEEFDENGWGRCISSQNALLDSPDDGCHMIDGDNKIRDRMELEYESTNGFQTQNNGAVNQFISCDANDLSGRKSSDQASPYNGEFMHGENGYIHSEVQVLVGLSGCDSDGAQSLGNSSNDFDYEQLSLEDKLLLELQSIGLYPETVPDLQDKEDEVINEEIVQLKSGLYQQVGKKKTRLNKIYEAIHGGKDVEGQDLEQVAMNKLVEIGYKKLLATRGNLAIKNGMPKVPRQVALAFAKRTIAKCKKFEDSGASCFNEPGLRDVIFAPPPQIDDAEPLDGVSAATANHPSRNNGDRGDMLEASGHQSDQAFARNGPILNRGKKKEVLLDDVGGAANRMTCLGNSLLGGARGKRSERDGSRDASFRNSIAKAGRSSLGNSKVERKTRPKPKQRTAQLSTSGSGYINNFAETGHPTYPSSGGSGDRKREIGLILPGGAPDMSKEMKESIDNSTMPLNDLDHMEELGEPKDINSWFMFDEDCVQDHDSMGLEIPMDDLSELNMF